MPKGTGAGGGGVTRICAANSGDGILCDLVEQFLLPARHD
jgi:hypothetical protein